jgi:hypothetical protein
MKDLNFTSMDKQHDLHHVQNILRCKWPDGNICIAEGFAKALLDK